MQISEVRKLKLELEQDVSDSIRRLVATFENKTDVNIDLLTLDYQDITTCNDNNRRYQYSVRADVKI